MVDFRVDGNPTSGDMETLLKDIGPILRNRGFKGSGKNFRKIEGDFVFVVNFQGSRSGDGSFVNLAAHPLFIPTVSDEPPDPTSIKEYECMVRRRVGKLWTSNADEVQRADLVSQLEKALDDFFCRSGRLKEALVHRSAHELVNDFSLGQTRAFSTLALARAALAVGELGKARDLVVLGLEMAGEAMGLRVKLKEVLKGVEAAEQAVAE